MTLPTPPVLKTTIIQLNKELDPEDNSNNYEILTNEYNNDNNVTQTIPNSPTFEVTTNMPNKKKRRRSTANIDSEELAKRKNETKQLHSIIEKRRRIKINREFEALKYLIPACRSSTPPNKKANTSNNNSSSNNGNKIDGMYKLTILKSSVEYILYLHHIIQKQHELITSSSDKLQDFDIDFAKVPLNVNQYRNIDKEFNFKDLLTDLEGSSDIKKSSSRTIIEEDETDSPEGDEEDKSRSASITSVPQSCPPSLSSSLNGRHRSSLPTPDFTPDMAPIMTALNKYSATNTNGIAGNRKGSYPVSPHTVGLKSSNPSPFTIPLKSTLSNSSSPALQSINNPNKSYTASVGNLKFALPDPAVNPSSQLNDVVPRRRKRVAGQIPEEDEEMNETENTSEEDVIKLADQDASKTLLSLRKSSIDSLLN
ncbi:hypothetical protein SBY92_000332 [Candida maltosa Xu316]